MNDANGKRKHNGRVKNDAKQAALDLLRNCIAKTAFLVVDATKAGFGPLASMEGPEGFVSICTVQEVTLFGNSHTVTFGEGWDLDFEKGRAYRNITVIVGDEQVNRLADITMVLTNVLQTVNTRRNDVRDAIRQREAEVQPVE